MQLTKGGSRIQGTLGVVVQEAARDMGLDFSMKDLQMEIED